MRISHEAIYQALYIQGRGALKRELVACLRTGRALRVPRSRTQQKAWAHVTPEVMISERPAEADDRAVPGHWEGDLLIGLERAAKEVLGQRGEEALGDGVVVGGGAADRDVDVGVAATLAEEQRDVLLALVGVVDQA